MTVAGTSGVDATGSTDRPPEAALDRNRLAAIDCLRAIAALGVLVSHTTALSDAWVTGAGPLLLRLGSVGVSLFFALSGYLLYQGLLAGRRPGGRRRSRRTYLARRALRILPAYWVALTVAAVVVDLPGVLESQWWAFYGLVYIYDAELIVQGLSPAWSLCTEAAFYLTLPLWAILMERGSRVLRRSGRRVPEITLLAILGTASILAGAAFVGEGGDSYRGALSLVGQFHFFAAGMILAVLRQRDRPSAEWLARLRRLSLVVVLPALLTIAYGIGVPRHPWYPPALGAGAWVAMQLLTLVVVTGCLTVAISYAPRAPASRAVRLLAWVGVVSYGIFLWHVPVALGLEETGLADLLPSLPFVSLTAMTLAGSVLLGAASFYGIERVVYNRYAPRA